MQHQIAEAKIEQILEDFDEDLKFFVKESSGSTRQLHLSKMQHLVTIAAMRIMTWEPSLETTKKDNHV